MLTAVVAWQISSEMAPAEDPSAAAAPNTDQPIHSDQQAPPAAPAPQAPPVVPDVAQHGNEHNFAAHSQAPPHGHSQPPPHGHSQAPLRGHSQPPPQQHPNSFAAPYGDLRFGSGGNMPATPADFARQNGVPANRPFAGHPQPGWTPPPGAAQFNAPLHQAGFPHYQPPSSSLAALWMQNDAGHGVPHELPPPHSFPAQPGQPFGSEQHFAHEQHLAALHGGRVGSPMRGMVQVLCGSFYVPHALCRSVSLALPLLYALCRLGPPL